MSIPVLWTEIDKAELIALRDVPIAMCNTAYGRFEEQKKRDLEQAYIFLPPIQLTTPPK